ncbi:FtsK/SpoIIIE family DNA translocase [Dellaglioa algida]|uniref:FtsK/SpoIIIE family DNA translocase n=1 Tax=Dellaglioa algida TaxID=105612 RepID=UPI000BD7195D|nr:DNA translocase FtsK [Dellaglioa algida]MDK1719144.1 DNA translocase FtsK [Dellaglioa algida]MDK1730413.1 DNA translocase FtsK [Dellaglioa algida]MDK1742814.1 DNA translocase FtsK [Dellaglioa algida]SOB51830.1 spore DNA translocase [Dellaglioa algida]
MAQKTKKRKKRTTKKTVQYKFSKNIIGAIFLLFGILGVLALGYLGTLFANVFRLFVGNTYQFALLILGVYGSYLMVMGKEPNLKKRISWGSLILYIGVLVFLEAWFVGHSDVHNQFIQYTWGTLVSDFRQSSVGSTVGGGMIGASLYQLSHFLVSQAGTYIVSTLFILAGLFIIFNLSFSEVMYTVHRYLNVIIAWSREGIRRSKVAFNSFKEERQENEMDLEEENPKPLVDLKPKVQEIEPESNLDIGKLPIITQQEPDPEPEVSDEPSLLASVVAEDNEDYQLPPVTLLTKIPKEDQSGEYKTIEKNTKILQQTFESFGVDVEIKSVSLGPSVTEYELHPAIGVKVSKIVNLADDLALALAAKDIRIEAPIPGKSLIGIEVPNSKISMVSFRDVIESQQKNPTPDKVLEVPLGRDVSGQLVTADLTTMPHLLIAGSTGSGKSVAINGIITSLLMNTKPNQVKFMLIDPKKVELGVYNGIPHLLTPVVTNPKKASRALHKVVSEMERRYELFADASQRNISGYNEMITQENKNDGQKRATLPYIVVIVDELADLMMVASNEVEDAIIRLAQMARAAGIHMILATQRPSVDVITGLIKANVPSRMAFAVSSGIDSRTIIDSNGAEKLLGRGDMLFLPMGLNKPIRVQDAYISDKDVESVIQFIKNQQEPQYDETMIVTDDETANSGSSADSEDELYGDAVKLVAHEQSCSVSMLQRRFRIGYNRAARIVDEMEAKGIVGPPEGSKPRKVLINEETDNPD